MPFVLSGAAALLIVQTPAEPAGSGCECWNVSRLSSEKLSGLGNSGTFYSVLVEVESANALRETIDKSGGLDAFRFSTV
jgi:hypothetical protein